MAAGLEFKPRILGFLCNWCCYGGADLCGVSRFQYPPYLRVVRVMCSGRVDLALIFRAFANGTDAVFVGGCHLNDCHYNTEGNYDALSVMHLGKKLLERIGVNPDRLRLEWVSAGEGIRFAEIMNDYGNRIKALGPLGSSEGIDPEALRSRIDTASSLVPYIKLVERERLRVRFSTEEEYKQFFDSEEVNRLFEETVADKLAMAQIVSLLREGPRSTAEIAKALGLTPSKVSKHLIASSRQRLVRYDQDGKRYALA
ncbi:MAG: hydrogenase iron-sulfur subunit [Pseudomonadota bacterium]